jgi:hypothetical protein
MRSASYVLGWVIGAASLVDAVQLQERQANWTVGQVVQTSSGPVTGHPASNNTDVSEYLGIPFAVPPVGDLRWTAPQRFNGTDPINGTSFVCFPSLFSYLGLFFCPSSVWITVGFLS